jgi:heparosan-N-sulfate-glucuronate 5-epimerase
MLAATDVALVTLRPSDVFKTAPLSKMFAAMAACCAHRAWRRRRVHILNGFIWALWGVYDYAQWSGSPEASRLWARCVGTLQRRLAEFDTGWWSLYEARDGTREMLASHYYHTLHITQLQVMHRLTGIDLFADTAARFQSYLDRPSYRAQAFARKAIFKLRHY